MEDAPLPILPSPRRSCQSCGFLAVQQYRGTDDSDTLAANTMLFDVGEDARRWGRVFRVRTPGTNHNDNGNPVCIKNVRHLQREMGYRGCMDVDCTPRALAFFAKPMDCDQWVQFTPGLSPEGHLWVDALSGFSKDMKDFFVAQRSEMDQSSKTATRWQVGVALLALLVAVYQTWLARAALTGTATPPLAPALGDSTH